jgi:hypothetical protein
MFAMDLLKGRHAQARLSVIMRFMAVLAWRLGVLLAAWISVWTGVTFKSTFSKSLWGYGVVKVGVSALAAGGKLWCAVLIVVPIILGAVVVMSFPHLRRIHTKAALRQDLEILLRSSPRPRADESLRLVSLWEKDAHAQAELLRWAHSNLELDVLRTMILLRPESVANGSIQYCGRVEPILYAAAYMPRLSLMKALVEAGAAVEARTSIGDTIVVTLVKSRGALRAGGEDFGWLPISLEAIAYLVEKGADVWGEGEDGMPVAISYAAATGDLEALQVLLRTPADHARACRTGKASAVHIALSWKFYDMAAFLVDGWIDAPTDPEGLEGLDEECTPWGVLARTCRSEDSAPARRMLSALVDEWEVEVGCLNPALQLGCVWGRVWVVDAVLDQAGTSLLHIHCPHAKCGETPHELACGWGHLEVVQSLVQRWGVSAGGGAEGGTSRRPSCGRRQTDTCTW